MNNPTVILNGDQVYCDELIRENARLTIQHEVDQQKMEALAGGDPCKVCAKVCMMGEGNCQPVWMGEKTV